MAYENKLKKKKKNEKDAKESTTGLRVDELTSAHKRVFSAAHIQTHLNSVSEQTDRLKVSIFTESGVLRKRAPYSLQEVVNLTRRRGPV